MGAKKKHNSKNVLSMPVGGKAGLMTIGSGNMYTSMTFMKTGSDGTKRLPDLESVASSKVETHIHIPEPF